MSSNTPPGYGAPQDPYEKNPYGQQQPPQTPGYGTPPPAGYGTPGYGAPGYGAPQGQLPGWLGQVPPGMPPAPGTRTLATPVDRFVARLLDGVIIGVVLGILSSIIGYNFVFLLLFAAAYVVYDGVMMLTQHGQTLGKKVMKIRVVSLAHGGRPTDNEFWARAGVWGGPAVVPCLGSLFMLVNGLWQLWDKPLQQALHDKAAKTVVVKEN
ncbi:RDD family protein [Kitasatospora sp. NPDC049285]|uniref:RDD family protein n=1 Tax=Kitasatospora sp. NPDC049285 TaxID=3157096 RepID=UPI00341319AA